MNWCELDLLMKSQSQRNALRSIAKKANEEIRELRQQAPGENPDIISTRVLNQHEETVTSLGFNRLWLAREIGLLNGAFKDR